MRYYLILPGLHTEICQLLTIHVEQEVQREEQYAHQLASSGNMLTYSSAIPSARAFLASIQDATQIGLNRWGLPCSPKEGKLHFLLCASQITPITRIAHKLGQGGIAQEIEGSPQMQVPDRFRITDARESFEIEHWSEEEAVETLAQAAWAQPPYAYQGMSGGFAIGGITRVYEPCEYTIEASPLTLIEEPKEGSLVNVLSMEAIFKINEELSCHNLTLDGETIKQITPPSDDLPF